MQLHVIQCVCVRVSRVCVCVCVYRACAFMCATFMCVITCRELCVPPSSLGVLACVEFVVPIMLHYFQLNECVTFSKTCKEAREFVRAHPIDNVVTPVFDMCAWRDTFPLGRRMKLATNFHAIMRTEDAASIVNTTAAESDVLLRYMHMMTSDSSDVATTSTMLPITAEASKLIYREAMELTGNTIYAHIKTVRELSVDPMASLVAGILPTLTQLEKLDVHRCEWLADDMLKPLVNLRVLNVSQCPKLTQRVLRYLSNVEELDIHIMFFMCAKILRSLPALHAFILDRCYGRMQLAHRSTDHVELLDLADPNIVRDVRALGLHRLCVLRFHGVNFFRDDSFGSTDPSAERIAKSITDRYYRASVRELLGE